ncbi:hypothetical protein FACS189472_05040 [Alphaproteobacteria bacterium]|nr:hypothetical protein FACS189472_05040 [Alphaproteobacteria bacterium]
MVANNPNEDTLTKSASNGMSANFFDALADIVSVCGESGANLDMTWASARPIESSLNIKNNFFVKKETIGTLRQAGIELKARTPEKNVEISGVVTTLHKDTGKESGTIKLVIPEKRKVISSIQQ